jgi:hypothetical protein
MRCTAYAVNAQNEEIKINIGFIWKKNWVKIHLDNKKIYVTNEVHALSRKRATNPQKNKLSDSKVNTSEVQDILDVRRRLFFHAFSVLFCSL